MHDLVVTAGTVITVDARRRVLSNGWVAVSGETIAAVGLGSPPPATRSIDRPDGIMIPGLVDAHGHAGHALLRTIGNDDLAAWLDACERIYLHGSTPAFWETDARLTAAERVLAGTTTGLSMLGGAGDTVRADDPVYADAHARGVTAVGIRDVVVIGPGAPPFPKATTDMRTGTAITTDLAGQLAVCEHIVNAWHGRKGVRVALTFPTLTEIAGPDVAEAAAALSALADRHGLLIVQDGHRGPSTEVSDRLGLLGPRSLLSHAVDLEPSHIELLASRGSAVAHNPNAIFSMFGRCPVPELLEAGVTVGLGSDGTGPDRSSDMFRHMFGATRHHRTERRDPAVLPPGTVLEMATIGAATALGIGDEIGSLEAGKAADIVVVDGARPHLRPLVSPVHQLVYYANGGDVETVVVAGAVIVDQGVIVTVSVPDLLGEAAVEHRNALAAAGITPTGDRPGTWSAIRYVDGSGIDGPSTASGSEEGHGRRT